MTYMVPPTANIPSLEYQILHDEKSRAKVLFEAGRSFMHNDKFAEASVMFQDCLAEIKYGKLGTVLTMKEIEEMIIPTLCNLAACALDARNFNEAESFCREVFRIRPRHEGANFLLSVVRAKSAKL